MKRRPYLIGAVVAGAVALAAMLSPARDRKPDVAALAYGVAVARACPGWTVLGQRTLAARGVLPRAGMQAWGDGGALHDAYWRGASAAERDARRDPAFCRRPGGGDVALERRLAGVLVPDHDH